jgi:hypothetical protein
MTTEPIIVNEHISYFFGLSYAAYFTVPRSVLEAMPDEWQERFVAMVNEIEETLDWGSLLPPDHHYTVRLRGKKGRFIHDPLQNYRRPVAIPLRASAPVAKKTE